MRRTGSVPLIRREAVAPTVGYGVARDCWELWRPCHQCGGALLPLVGRPELRDSVLEIKAFVSGLPLRQCPECETRRRRASSTAREPAVWFDTLLDDWVLRLAGEHGCDVILPLEIPWFDAPGALVYRKASDIAHSGDAFDGSAASG